ncbi:glycosyl hydrolase family 39 [Streptomyces sp. 846.5]|nr:CBM35 domain-containing protein [Streptomyces sp. 846.5]TDU05939.1 glycosyl hydrolase family 39 [Streptomyces sp. 846.5]
MRVRPRAGRWAAAVAGAVALALPLLSVPSTTAVADTPSVRALNVDLSSNAGKATGVGLGLLYGMSADATQPADQYLKPLDINAFRGGGWFSGGWIKDDYQYGNAAKADVASIIAQAKRLEKQNGPGFQYQVLLSDLYGANGGEPGNTQWPCADGDCSNYVTFLTTTIKALEKSGINFAFDIWNEPEFSFFWGPGVNTPQYFQMWDTAYRTIRSVAPTATIAGPSFAYTPQRNPAEWQTWFAHVKAEHTVPDVISNHDEGDVDDPVAVGQAIEADAADAGLGHLPLSANEYQPADRQTAGVTAWYLDRFAQSSYTTAMRGNWRCCMIPNLTGLLTQTATGWAPTGNWWAMRTYADMTGTKVATSGAVASTAISASKDKAQNRAVAMVGDSDGYTGPASVTLSGLSSVPWLVKHGAVHVTVYRIPDTGPLYSPQVVSSQTLSAAGGSVTVPFTFQSAHDAFAVYLSWDGAQTVALNAPDELSAPGTYDVPVTFSNRSGVKDTTVNTSLAISSADPADAALLTVTCKGTTRKTCPAVGSLPPGASTTSTYQVTVPATAPAVAYRFTVTAKAVTPDGPITVQNASDLIVPCGLGDVCEAETGNLTGGACSANDHTGSTGTGFVACLTSTGPGVTQQFNAPTTGGYTFDVRYAAGPNGPGGTRTATVSANGTAQGQIQLPETGSWDTWADATITVQLPAGPNTIGVSVGAGDTGWYNIDHFVLTSATAG